ncbi:MAG: hypothetical protein WBC44_21955 [Planctomycetaceae bacterium]
MGAALYVVFEKDIPDFDAFVNGKALSAAERPLERVANQLGVTPLMSFFSIDPQEAADFLDEEMLDEQGEESIDVPPEQWFDAGLGLKTVRALRQHLRDDPQVVRNAEAVLSDLDEFEAVLQRAEAAGVRWHLAVDY